MGRRRLSNEEQDRALRNWEDARIDPPDDDSEEPEEPDFEPPEDDGTWLDEDGNWQPR